MKNILCILLAILTALPSFGATVSINLKDINGTAASVAVTFSPRSTPGVLNPSLIISGDKSVTTSTNGTGTIELVPGDYMLKIAGRPLDNRVVTVGTNSTYALIDIITNVTTFTNPSSPVYVMKSDYVSTGDILTKHTNGAVTNLAVGTQGQVLTVDTNEPTKLKWSSAGGGSGTVTSVAATSDWLTVGGSPITGAGTLTLNIPYLPQPASANLTNWSAISTNLVASNAANILIVSNQLLTANANILTVSNQVATLSNAFNTLSNGFTVVSNGFTIVSNGLTIVSNGLASVSNELVNVTNTYVRGVAAGTGVTTSTNNGVVTVNATGGGGGTTLTNANALLTKLVNDNTNAVKTLSSANGLVVLTDQGTNVLISVTNSGTVVQRKVVAITNRYAFTPTVIGVTTNANSDVGQAIITNSFQAISTANYLKMTVHTYAGSSLARGLIGIIGGALTNAFDTHYLVTPNASSATFPVAFQSYGLAEATTNVNYVFRVAVDSGAGTVGVNRRNDTDSSFGGASQIVFTIEEIIP